ncbi:hypothetical protein P154DRAFT_531926 [Amniculicola lignicola CBS 123094]|uniref:Uncharacterized protein n=1 Tax=Amniculicola lignicola CBS 123094 TaxID=1392246 RepID=A0A6A5WS57_9PLEO|nr:hypothetical protein P154DRAFT_531926 [Amniculicola lignicola CBS 123094]
MASTVEVSAVNGGGRLHYEEDDANLGDLIIYCDRAPGSLNQTRSLRARHPPELSARSSGSILCALHRDADDGGYLGSRRATVPASRGVNLCVLQQEPLSISPMEHMSPTAYAPRPPPVAREIPAYAPMIDLTDAELVTAAVNRSRGPLNDADYVVVLDEDKDLKSLLEAKLQEKLRVL